MGSVGQREKREGEGGALGRAAIGLRDVAGPRGRERGQLGHSVGAAAALADCRNRPGLGRDLGLQARSREGEVFLFFCFSFIPKAI